MNCVLLSGGLFQIYANNEENYLSYEDIANKLIKSYSKQYLNISNIFEKYKKIKSGIKNINKENEMFLKEFKDNNKTFNLFEENKNNFEKIDLKLLYSFLNKFQKIFFNYDNLLYLLFDLNVFHLLNIETENIIFCLNIKELFQQDNIDYKKYIIFDTKLENLLYYHNLGCFTAYLAHLVKMDLVNDEQRNYIDKYNDDNLSIINKAGIFFDFSVLFMVHILNYINYISNYVKELKPFEGNTLSEKIINKTGAYNILFMYRYFFKKGEIKRANFFICNDKVLYTVFIGNNKKDCYYYLNKYYISNKYQRPKGILPKLTSKICLNEYGQLITDLIKIKKENNDIFFFVNPENITKFVNRGKQIYMINCFIKECINDKKIFLPKTKEENYNNIDTYEKFKQFMKENDLQFPLILKFSGETINYDHLIINILCDSGLINFINYFKEYTKNDNKEKIKIVVQQFINHGGYVVKLYRIANKSHFYYRPSFPDCKVEFINKFEEYKRGFLELTTNFLVSEDYKIFWKKVNGVNDNYKNNVNEEIIIEIGKKFEQYTGDTLIGLDFLLDIEKKIYYLIDVNQFPGYKELNKDMEYILKDHILHHIKSNL